MVNQNQNGQYQTTILKALGDAPDLKGNHIEWKVSSGSALEGKSSLMMVISLYI